MKVDETGLLVYVADASADSPLVVTSNYGKFSVHVYFDAEKEEIMGIEVLKDARPHAAFGLIPAASYIDALKYGDYAE